MSDLKQFTRKEISTRNTKDDAVTIIDNLVYDLTPFLDDHPGGHEVLLNVVGKEASEDFEDVGHSIDAKELMKKYVIGQIVPEERIEVKKKTFTWDDKSSPASSSAATENSSFINSWKFPVLLGLVMTLMYTYLFG
ncbi:cytochrome b5-like [Zerene cesonia]|uniref:cytochrome b5-like n=1 Tax=Zerene cesonia TaxID=33412 RepID=UPI0018E530E4|nr:cytochrome b5-like [Zerene cesonia]